MRDVGTAHRTDVKTEKEKQVEIVQFTLGRINSITHDTTRHILLLFKFIP